MRLAACPVPVSSGSDSLTTPPSRSFDAGDHAVGWASRAPEARGTADRTVTLGEPDPAEAVTGRFESVELGRAVLLVVEQIDQLPGVRTDVGNADGHRPVGEVVRKQHAPPGGGCPVNQTWGSLTSITSWSPTPTSAH